MEKGTFEMKKYLLLAGLLTALTINNANAQRYYYDNDGYYNESPRYEMQQPRYRRLTNAEVRQYREKQAYRSEAPVVNNFRPYIGFDVAHSKLDLGKLATTRTFHARAGSEGSYRAEFIHEKSLKDKFTTGTAVFGTKLNPYFGLEAFYQFETHGKKSDYQKIQYTDGQATDSYDRNLAYHAVGLDLQGYLPFNQEIELLASLGLGEYYFTTSTYETFKYSGSFYEIYLNNSHQKYDTLGIRMGIGAQYNITQHFALRGIVRYVKMTDDDIVKNLIEASLGLRYMF